MIRRDWLRTAALCSGAFYLAGLTTGCGGGNRVGSDNPSTDTGTSGGSLSAVQISPPPGSTYISKHTTFRFLWDPSTPPPPSFEARLIRYKEARGEEVREVDTQRTILTRIGDGYVWELARSDNFDLDEDGVYFVQLNAPGEEVRASYIVTDD